MRMATGIRLRIVAIPICSAVLALAQASFKSAEVVSATDVQYPIRSIADGVVILDVSLDSKGAVTRTTVVRGIGSLTPVATSSVQSWTFHPASEEGEPRASEIRIAFVFRPRAQLAAPPNFKSVLSNAESAPNHESGYVPAGIIAVAYPEYPINAVWPGAVVVQVSLDKGGKIGHMEIIRDWQPFTRFALSAARKWQFQAATLNGKSIVSNVPIAFVFAPRVTNYR